MTLLDLQPPVPKELKDKGWGYATLPTMPAEIFDAMISHLGDNVQIISSRRLPWLITHDGKHYALEGEQQAGGSFFVEPEAFRAMGRHFTNIDYSQVFDRIAAKKFIKLQELNA